jgi:poly(hydroxyalkanoate) depolymerase family esterase
MALCGAAILAGCTLGTAPRGIVGTQVADFGSNPAHLRMYEYVPAELPASPPLVVVLHHCFQTAHDYVLEAGWQMLADRYKFVLLMPEQVSGNDPNLCFTWWSAHEGRGQGAVESIRQMIEKIVADRNIDRSRIFVTGLSSGAGMSTIMLASHPEIFAGGGVIGNAPFRCARALIEALFTCMPGLRDRDPQDWGDTVREESGHQGPWPTLSVWHGDVDVIVFPSNAEELIEQWTNLHGADAAPDREDQVEGYSHYGYEDASGRVVVEYYSITGMGHSTPVDPTRGCGDDREGFGDFIHDYGICSSFYIARFWGLTGDDTSWPPPDFVMPAATGGGEAAPMQEEVTPPPAEAVPAEELMPQPEPATPAVEQQDSETAPAEQAGPEMEETSPSPAAPSEEQVLPLDEDEDEPAEPQALPAAEAEEGPEQEPDAASGVEEVDQDIDDWPLWTIQDDDAAGDDVSAADDGGMAPVELTR